MNRFILGLTLLGISSACRTDCITNLNFPVCEYRFERSQTYIYDFTQVSLDTEVLNIGSNARLKLSGDTYLGDSWTLSNEGDHLWIGLPSISRVLEVSIEELLACPNNKEWMLIDRNSGNFPPNIDITPLDNTCSLRPTLKQYIGAGRFGSTLLPTESPTGEQQLWIGSPRTDGRRGLVSLFQEPTLDYPEPIVTWEGPEAGAEWGHTLVACGDVTGDGTADIIMASPTANRNQGAIQLVGSESIATLATEQTATDSEQDVWTGAAPGDHAGTSIWCSGDLTGDAFADILIGAPFDNSCGGDADITNCGVVYLLEGGPNRAPSGSISDHAVRVLRGPSANGFCGQTMAAADFDRDGAIDLAIGCPGTNAGKGGALLYSGQTLTQTFSTPAGFLDGRGYPNTNETLTTKDHFGLSMAIADLNQLGQPGIFMGSPTVTSPTGSIHAGALEFWSGRSVAGVLAGRDPAQPNIRIQGNAPFHSVGRTILWGDYLFMTTRED